MYLNDDNDNNNNNHNNNQSSSSNMSLGTYIAIFDQVTSCSMSLVRNNTVGVSVMLEAKHCSFPTTSQIDIHTIVTKMGRNLAFCRMEARNVDQGNALVCTGSHINFLNLGTSTWYSDFFFKRPRGFPLYRLYYDTTRRVLLGRKETAQPQHRLSEIVLPYFQPDPTKIGKASFQVKSLHENYTSGFHGGCQAIVMELTGRRLARAVLRHSSPLLESIEIKYQSVGSGIVDLMAFVEVVHNDSRLSMRVEMRRRQQQQQQQQQQQREQSRVLLNSLSMFR